VDVPLNPPSLFQLLFGTTPATSVLAMGVPVPENLMLMVFPEPPVVELTVSGRLIVWVSEALAPVILNMELPAGVFGPALIKRVEFAPGATAAGLREAVAPAGNPLTLRFTEPLNPLSAPTLTAEVVVLPLLTEEEVGALESVKSGFETCPIGTIWMAFRGARQTPSEPGPGIADSVKPVLLMVNRT
jgi:hypothetical protein